MHLTSAPYRLTILAEMAQNDISLLCLLMKSPHGLLGILEVLIKEHEDMSFCGLLKSVFAPVSMTLQHIITHESPYRLRITSQPFMLHHLENNNNIFFLVYA